MNGLLTIANNMWIGRMNDLVPKEMRGRDLGIRNTILGFIGMTVSFTRARLLDYFKGMNQKSSGFAPILPICCYCLDHCGFPFKPAARNHHRSKIRLRRIVLKLIILGPLHNMNFRKFLNFIIFWYLTSGIASPFYMVFLLKNLSLPYSTIVLYSIFAGVMNLIFQIL